MKLIEFRERYTHAQLMKMIKCLRWLLVRVTARLPFVYVRISVCNARTYVYILYICTLYMLLLKRTLYSSINIEAPCRQYVCHN